MKIDEQIRLVEEDMNHTICDKIELILILSGEKPATIFELQNTFLLLYNKRRIREVSEFYQRLELPFLIRESAINLQFIGDIFVARDDYWFNRLLWANELDDDFELGKCYGFPDTSIETFSKGEEYLADLGVVEKSAVQCSNIDLCKLEPFMHFRFSREHLYEEFVSTSLRWHNTIKTLSPRLYDQIGKVESINLPFLPTSEEKRHSYVW